MSTTQGTPIATLLDGYAAKSVEELDLLVQKGLNGLSVIGADDGSIGVMIFAGDAAGKVFAKFAEQLKDMPEYQAFLETLQPAASLNGQPHE